MNKGMGLLVSVALIIAFSAMTVMAAPVYNAQGTIGANDTAGAGTADSFVAYGGNITQLDVTATKQTTYWTGYFGSVTQTVKLAGAANDFYNWGATNPTGWVLLANSSSVNWGGIAAGTSTNLATENTALGLGTSAENMTNTFTGTNAADIVIGSNTITTGSAPATTTLSNGGSNWETAFLVDGSGAVVYAGAIQQNNNNYAGNPVDYQVMVPVNAGSGQRTYYLFAALN